ncbi:MAG TPA: HAD-IA family hydrolase [Candidatus Limnocylindrales bacterium]
MTAAGTGVEAVIFDLDGVIVDSEIWWDEARRDFAADRDRRWTEDDRVAVMGANSRQWSRIMRDRLDIDDSPESIERAIVDAVVARYRRDGAPRIDGAVEAVRRIAARWPSAVASSAHREVIDAALGATGLIDTFRVVVSSDEVAHGKPAPDVYVETARRLGVPPERCLVVEDSYNGVRAGRDAGMRVVLVPNATIPPAPGTEAMATTTVARLADLDPASLPEPAGRPAPVDATSSRHPRADSRRHFGRYLFARVVSWVLVHAYVRLRVEGREKIPDAPVVYCFNHLNWSDPMILLASLPIRPRVFFFGPKEQDMSLGRRNRLMGWSNVTVPYKPGKDDMLDAARRVRNVFATGGALAIAGEGRIHAGESELLPLEEGVAYFALGSGVPIVPVAISGSSWLRFGRRIRVRIGDPLPATGRPTRDAVRRLTSATWEALHGLVAGAPDFPPPGRFGRWLTERFNDWPEGSRPPVRR